MSRFAQYDREIVRWPFAALSAAVILFGAAGVGNFVRENI